MMGSMDAERVSDVLCGAIARRAVVAVEYAGTRRLLAPHAVFRSATGQALLHALEVAGGDAAPLPGLRNFDLRHIGACEPTDRTFTPDPAFDPAARRFRYGVDCVVDRG